VSIVGPVRDYVHSLVHVSARDDALTAARHRAFIAPRLLGGLSALSVLPVQLAVCGVPTPLEMAVFGWLITGLLGIFYLTRAGRLEHAYMLSALALTALIAGAASISGGLGSNLVMLLVVVPLEAGLSASRRVVLFSCAMSLAALGMLFVADQLGAAGMVPEALDRGPSALPAIAAATVYATGIALGSGWLADIGKDLLGAEEARYHLLAANMMDVIVRHSPSGAVLFVSPAAEVLTGVSASRLRGHHLLDRVHVADRPAYLTALSEAANDGQSCSVEFRLLQGSENVAEASPPRYVWVEMRCRPLEPDRGEPGQRQREVVAVLRDVTDRKVQEQALVGAREEAERANAAKGRFLATMSHELRTPLNAIIGFSDMLIGEREFKLDAARRRDYAQLVNESGQHLLSVVNGILDMSRLESGNFEITPEPFSLGPVIAGCCQLLALKAHEAGVDLVHRHGASLPEIVADKRAVKQVLLNLVSNAIKFTRGGGRVTVSAAADLHVVAILVEDTGVGIADSDLKRLGDPFFQIRGSYDRPHDGTGLGLSIVKGLVDLHGGQMNIDSRIGEGTRITVRLPLNCERAPRKAEQSHATYSGSVAAFVPAIARRIKKSA
jgi:cell cycle sensor histidine kinase DivJ